MKNKYQRLTSKEKKQALADYIKADEKNADIHKRIKRLKVISVIGIIYAILSFFLDFFLDTIVVWDYVLDGLLLIFCIGFLIKANSILEQQVNKFLINKPKKK